jgi:succinyl-diaminopimelate desuccinylase
VDHVRLTVTARLLRDLIALPSVNPALLPRNDPHAGEHRVVEFLAAAARRGGLEVERQAVGKGRNNLLVRLGPIRPPRQRVVLAPHLDTVGGNEIPGHLFDPRVKSGRLYGRGACDTKGSVAGMFTALLDVAKAGCRPAQTEIVLAGLVGEECGQDGSRALAASGFKADLAIIGEPTRLQVVTAHKGDVWFTLQTRGQAAHGARPELGRNAVHEMARIVDALETDYARRLRRHRHPLLGHATINVGTIRGGRQPNIVPDECVISIDRRTLPGERDSRVRREILAFLQSRGLRACITGTETHPCPPLETNPAHPLVQHLLDIARQAQPAGVHYFSDAGVLGAAGIPSVLLGPGDIAQAHTADEWISLRQLERGRDLLLRFLRSLP